MDKIPLSEWQARTMLLERLMVTVLPPPVEVKPDYIKLNMMAQIVSSF